MSNNQVFDLPINDITIENRVRKEHGDLQELADSMAEGLLQPIGVTSENVLVFGERRFLAARDILGWETIPAKVVDVQSVLHGQFAENLIRKQYTVSERVAIVEAMRSYQHGGDRRSDQALKCDEEKVTVDKAAKLAGLGGKDGYARAKAVIDQGVPELVEAMDDQRLSISAAAKLAKEATPDEQSECLTKRLDEKCWTANGVGRALRRVRADKTRQELMSKSVAVPNFHDLIQIYHCRFQDLEQTANLEPESVNLICTDIPYGNDFLDDLEQLAELAQRLLSPNGLFVSYIGQYRLDEKMELLSRHLKYVWLGTSTWVGTGNPSFTAMVVSRSIPIVIYSKGQWSSKRQWYDTLAPQEREKEWHEWQRPLEEVETLIGNFSEPGDLVVDPCGGGFTTAVACRNLGRRFVGCDIDKAAVVKGQERLFGNGKPAEGRHQTNRISTNGIDTSPATSEERPLEKADLLPISEAKPVPVNSVTEGDCREMISRLPSGSINFCLTSPPYAEQRKGKYPSVPEREYSQYTVRWMAELWDKLTEDGSVMIIIDPHVKAGVMSNYVRRTEEALCQFGWVQHQTQIWHKPDRAPLGHKGWPRHCWESILWFGKSEKSFCDPLACGQPSDRLAIEKVRHSNWTPGGKSKRSGIARVPDVWDVPVGGNEKGIDHPAMFPVELAEQLIRTYCPPNGTVLDPFAGSGSTLVAAQKLGCDYYGFDIVADYCQIARKRLGAAPNESKVSAAG